VRPELTIDVQFLEWTAFGQARHMSYKACTGGRKSSANVSATALSGEHARR
jgi:hypothetical protein